MTNALRWGVNSWLFLACTLFLWTLSICSGKVYISFSSAQSSSPLVPSSSTSSSQSSKRKTSKYVASVSSTNFNPQSNSVRRIHSSSPSPRKCHLRLSQVVQSQKRQTTVARRKFLNPLTTIRNTVATSMRGGAESLVVIAKAPISTNIDDVVHSNATIAAGTGNIFTKFDENNKKVLTYYGLMLAGAIARSASATAVHPLNVIKVMLQTKHGVIPELKWSVLSRGAGSQFIMSVPHGAVSFAVTETTKKELAKFVKTSSLAQYIPHRYLNPAMDFLSSSVSTFLCSAISTPQMVLTDQIMAGSYDNFFAAVYSIAMEEGAIGFYKGWLPALAQKIPSYALTWMFFQQFKTMFIAAMDRPGTTLENTLLGAIAAAGACCVMIPVDTIKTRLVLQKIGDGGQHYSGMLDCFQKILKQEGVSSFYRSLTPRLLSVMPMIGIQFGVYELVKRLLIGLPAPKSPAGKEYYHTHHDYFDTAATNTSKTQ